MSDLRIVPPQVHDDPMTAEMSQEVLDGIFGAVYHCIANGFHNDEKELWFKDLQKVMIETTDPMEAEVARDIISLALVTMLEKGALCFSTFYGWSVNSDFDWPVDKKWSQL